MNELKEQKKAEKEIARKKKKILKNSENNEVRRMVNEIIPIKGYNTYLEAFEMIDGSYFDIMEIRCKDLNAIGEEAVNIDCKTFLKFLRLYANDIKIVGMNFPIDTSSQQNYFNHILKRTENPIYRNYINHQLEIMKVLEEMQENQFYLFAYWKDDREMGEQRGRIYNVLGQRGLINKIDQRKKEMILFKVNNKNTPLSNYRPVPQLSEEQKLENETLGFDKALIQRIQPQGGINFTDEDRFTHTGDGYEACLSIWDYPEVLNLFWMQDFMTIRNGVSVMELSPMDKGEVKRNINRSMGEQQSRYDTAKDSTDRRDAQARYSELEELINAINHTGEIIEKVNIRLFVSAPTWQELDNRIDEIKTNLESNQYKCTIYVGEQYEDWTSIYKPFSKQVNNMLYERKGHPFTSNTIAHGNPFHFSSLSDPFGSYFGESEATKGAVMFDYFYKSNKRTHYNGLAIGTMGSGKSTLLKKIFQDRANKGDFIRAFDVAGEYTSLVHHYGGKLINLDGSDGRINPLEVLRTSDDERQCYTQHVAKLNTIYRFLKPTATDSELYTYENLLGELYIRFGLMDEKGSPVMPDETGNTNNPRITGLRPNQYPIFSDLSALAGEKLAVDITEMTENEKYVYTKFMDSVIEVKAVIDNVISNYRDMFDGYTTMENILDTQIVVFNIKGLAKMTPNIFDAQIFSALSMCYDNCVKLGTTMKNAYEANLSGDKVNGIEWEDLTRFLIILDEAHRIINTNKLSAVNQIVTYCREGRKFFGGILFASQSIDDFAPEGSSSEALMQIKQIFALCQYKFILKEDGIAIDSLKRVFRNEITDNEVEGVPEFEQGETLLVISGDRNVKFKVFLTEEENQLFEGGA